VWAGGGIVATRCPESTITADSIAWVELWRAMQVAGSTVAVTEARDLDAIMLLNQEACRVREQGGRDGR